MMMMNYDDDDDDDDDDDNIQWTRFKEILSCRQVTLITNKSRKAQYPQLRGYQITTHLILFFYLGLY